jgi:hypothetical protein
MRPLSIQPITPPGPHVRVNAAIFFAVAFSIPTSANAETFDYACTVGDLAIHIHVNASAKSVTQQVQSGPTTLTAEYMDGVFGKVSERGMAALIPPMHQLVRISENSIAYGGELDGSKDIAVLDRRVNTLTLANGKAGWCTPAIP